MRKMVDIDQVDNLKYQLDTAKKLLSYLLEKDYMYTYYSQKEKDVYCQVGRAQELYTDTQNILNVIYDKINEVSECFEHLIKKDGTEVK